MTDRSRRRFDLDVYSLQTLYTIETDEYSLRPTHPRRYIYRNLGVWNDGSHNYRVAATWGWLTGHNTIEFTLTQPFDVDDAELYLDSVVGLRKDDVGTLPDGTVLTIVAIDRANLKVIVEGSDLLTTAASIGNTFTRWGRVPGGIRDFVIEAVYMFAGGSDTGDCPWLRRERTDTYEYERFTREEAGLAGTEWWTGIPMIDQGLLRYKRPPWRSII
jgi:hypothetical protein